MRSWTRLRSPGRASLARRAAPARARRTAAALLGAALALSGCGNYSTEDLRFLAALPQREDLAFAVPSAPNGALSACPPANASVWLWAKPVSDQINGGVDFLLSLVDVVRSISPTWRADDRRVWGPFPSKDHPGREIEVVMDRSYPAELGGRARYSYAFLARVTGTTDFTPLVGGAFDGGSASRGRGVVVLDLGAMKAVGMNDGTAAGTMQIGYDRASDPATIQLALASDAFGAVQFGYRYAGYAAGGGVFDFAFRDANATLFYVSTGFDARGAGRAAVAFQTAGGATGGFRQCWAANACLVYVLDPANVSCPQADQPCSYGVETDCPPVPASPF
ncbi:MAG TPA: hypothetical protein VF841_13205 [Anaeromyxobacter sp.]